eukprot:gene19868-6996_t
MLSKKLLQSSIYSDRSSVLERVREFSDGFQGYPLPRGC